MPKCVRCQNEIKGLSKLFYSSKTGRCDKCEGEVEQGLKAFRQGFIKFCEDGIIQDEEWNKLQYGVNKYRLNWEECIGYVRGDAIHFLERQLTFISADGVITNSEEQYFRELSTKLLIPAQLLAPLENRLNYLKNISVIRQGRLPAIKSSVHLQAGETCHLEIPANYIKVNKSSTSQVPGRIVATNQAIHFLSSQGGWDISWKNVMRVEAERNSIYLELSVKKGNGHYLVADTLYAEAVLNALVQVNKRLLLMPQDEKGVRRIPQDVKLAVWQRDQAKCVQCGADTYLEFDHIIPFSKGGASTVNNVQLLCRKCNLAKSDRI